MKFFSLSKTRQTRVNPQDSLGHGLDAAILMIIFVGVGYGLDRLFGTLPWFMVILTVIGAVGVFATFKYRYEAKMNEHDDRRRNPARPADSASAGGATEGPGTTAAPASTCASTRAGENS